ncbi:MAG TPA: acyltransferase family protein [Vicinamibacterales bacterium]|jgi:hypothetical protein
MPAQSRDRVQFIDIARGSAMFFVLLSHFAFTYFARSDSTRPALTFIGMVASPTFVMINGLLLGLIFRTRPQDFDRFRTIVIDRGLFLLTIGHILILLSHVTYAVRFLSITDTVGVCMLISPGLISVMGARGRLITSVVGYAVSAVVYLSWYPIGLHAHVFKEAFFGVAEHSRFTYAFPIVPWFCWQLAATVLGEQLGARVLSDDTPAVHALLLRTAAACLTIAMLLKVSYHLAVRLGAAPSDALYDATSPFTKAPPSLVYLLFYGSLGLVMLSLSLGLAKSARMRFAAARLAALGQTSFPIFVIQFFVYFTVLPLIRPHLPWPSLWPLYFSITTVAVAIPALFWHRAGGNRFLTVGYPRMASGLGDLRECWPLWLRRSQPRRML